MHSYYPRQGCLVTPYGITFTEVEVERINLPHNNTLVITMMVANFQVYRILVYNGSSADILYIETLGKMNIGKDKQGRSKQL